MTLVSKTAASPADLRGVNLYRVAIVGAASLMGKEIAEVLRDRNFSTVDIRLLDDDESLGRLEAVGDEMTFIQSIRPEQFEHVDFTFFAADPRATRAKWETARDFGNTIIDTTAALEDVPGATIRSPWIEREIIGRGTGRPTLPELQPGPVVVAHPAAIALAMLALRAEKLGKIERMITTVFEPASEYGQRGMDELHEQTINLLSFQDLPKKVFDVQVAFNMVARFGSASHHSLAKFREAHSQALSQPCALGDRSLRCRSSRPPYSTGTPFRFIWRPINPSRSRISAAFAGEHMVIAAADDNADNVSYLRQEEIRNVAGR